MKLRELCDRKLMVKLCGAVTLYSCFIAMLSAIDMYQYRTKEHTINELKEYIVDLRTELKDTNDEIFRLYDELSKFTNRIEYHSNPAPLYDIALPVELQEYTYDMCIYYDIEDCYETVLAMMWRESNFDPTLISETDDWGLMQINEINHEELQEKFGSVDFLDPYDNIDCGVYIISTLVHEYDDVHKALMAYNMGRRGAESLWERGHHSSYYSRDIVEFAEQLVTDNYRTN